MVQLLTETQKDELARTYQLGRFQKEYQVRAASVIGGIVIMVFGVVAFLLTYAFIAFNLSNSLASSLIALILCGIFLGGGILVFWLGKRRVDRYRHWGISLYEHGLIYSGQGLYYPMHWKSVQRIVHTVLGDGGAEGDTYYIHHYKIYCKDGVELAERGVIAETLIGVLFLKNVLWTGGRGSTFVRGAELIKIIEERSASYLLEEALHLLKSTGQASFGALTVTQQGILVRGHFLPWQEFERFFLSLDNTTLVFMKKGERRMWWQRHALDDRVWWQRYMSDYRVWQYCALDDVVNYEVFQQLMTMLRGN